MENSKMEVIFYVNIFIAILCVNERKKIIAVMLQIHNCVKYLFKEISI